MKFKVQQLTITQVEVEANSKEEAVVIANHSSVVPLFQKVIAVKSSHYSWLCNSTIRDGDHEYNEKLFVTAESKEQAWGWIGVDQFAPVDKDRPKGWQETGDDYRHYLFQDLVPVPAVLIGLTDDFLYKGVTF